ncbi:hypothetical protein [Chryseobacterium terrae]|uniref:TraB family protein n=1 Tax=Chryseobacterium terrae TaxID=3163299 RepID=A0ABW8XZR2_9FLAO
MKPILLIAFTIMSVLIFGQNKVIFPTLQYTSISSMNIELPYIKWYGKYLLVYGSNHTLNFNDPQVKQIDSLIVAYKPTVVLYEGDGIATTKTKKETVETYFEMGLAKYIADSLNIKTINIEPNTQDKFKYLKKKYKPEDILIATLGLQITMMQYNNEDFESLYPTMISDIEKEGLKLTKKQKSLSYFYQLYQKKLNKPFSYENFDSREIQAKYSKTIFNKINQDANSFRDQHIIKLTNELLGKNERVFLIEGGWHAIVCEPAFKLITK